MDHSNKENEGFLTIKHLAFKIKINLYLDI